MIELPLTKSWTGDGFGAADARQMTQIKRSPNAAVYEVKAAKGEVVGYEVFKIKVTPKGTDIYGTILEDDTENYPCKGSFGKTAWFITDMSKALVRFYEIDQLVTDTLEETESTQPLTTNSVPSKRGRKKIEREPLKFPNGEFSVNELAEFNQVTYVVAFTLMKEEETKGKVKFVRSERRNAKGKPTKIFQANGI